MSCTYLSGGNSGVMCTNMFVQPYICTFTGEYSSDSEDDEFLKDIRELALHAKNDLDMEESLVVRCYYILVSLL